MTKENSARSPEGAEYGSRHLMRSSHFIPFFMGALFAAVACSSDDPEDDINPSGTGGTVTATGGAAATGGSNQVGSGGVVTGTGGTSTGSGGAVEGTGGSEVIIDTDTFYLSTTDAGVPFGIGVYDYNDEAGSTFTTTVETPGTICTTGTAAQVTDINGDGSDDYDLVYGGGIGINMNTEELITADLTGCTGFSFTIDSVPSGFRVGVAMDTPEGVTYFTTATAGENTVNFADIMAGEWVTDPPPLDIARIKDMQFQVSTNTNAAVPFTFCLSNLQMLGECTPPTPMDGTGGAGMGTGGEGMGTGGEGMGTGGEGSGGDPGTGGEMGSGGDPGTGGEMGSGGDPGAGGSPE